MSDIKQNVCMIEQAQYSILPEHKCLMFFPQWGPRLMHLQFNFWYIEMMFLLRTDFCFHECTPSLRIDAISFLQSFKIYFFVVWIPNLTIYVNISVSLQFCFWHIFYFWIASKTNLASHSRADSCAVLNLDTTGVGSRQVDIRNAYSTIQLGGGKTKRD